MNIKEMRIKNGMSQIEFSRAMNVSQPTVSAWENNESLPKSSKLKRIAEVLNCKIEELFENVEEKNEQT